MTGEHADNLAQLSLTDLEKVDQLCARFEASWKQGGNPRIEDFLSAGPARARTGLLTAILELDVEYRRHNGDQPAAADYTARFPEDAAVIDACCTPSATFPRRDATVGPANPIAHDEVLPVVPGYELLGVLGSGGMGVVYKARQVGLNRVVALKMIQPGHLGAPERLARFRAEAQAVARLQHPHIVQIHEVAEWRSPDGGPTFPYFSLEYVDGGSLAEHLKGNRLSPRSAAQLVQILAQAVHHAHKHGIIHRDLKPANVLLTAEHTPKVTDFGLAKSLEGGAEHTRTGEVLGTPNYMAPEQASGRPDAIGPAADVWALGVILYECLTGRAPFKGESLLDTLEQVRSHSPITPRKLAPRLPRDLETIALQCLQKEPRRRYASAAALAEDLRRFLEGEPILARPVAVWQQAALWVRRQPRTAALLMLVIGSAALGAVSLSRAFLSARLVAAAEQARADDVSRAREMEHELRQQAEHSLNVGRVILADREWQANNVAAAESLLAQCIPDAGQPDLRGWEWYYLQSLCHSNLYRLEHRFWVNSAAYSPDGQMLATAAGSPGGGIGDPRRDGELKLWEAATGRLITTLVGEGQPAAAVLRVSFSPDSRWLLARDATEMWRVWEVATRRECIAVMASNVGFLPDGQTLGVVSRDGEFNHIDLYSGRNLLKASSLLEPRPQQSVRADFGMGGRRVVIYVPDSKILRVLDSTTGKDLRVLESPGGANDLVLSPDGKRLVDADRLWNLETSQDLGSLGQMWANAQFSPTSDWLVRHLWMEVFIHDGRTGQIVHRLRGHSGQINRCCFGPDGRQLATAGTDQTVRLWDVKAGEQTAVLRGHASGVRDLAFSPDGRRIVTCSQDQTARVWDLTRDQRGLRLPGFDDHGEYLGNLAFTAGGREIILVHQHVKAWWTRQDAVTGETRAKHHIDIRLRYDAPRYDSAVSADGRVLVAVSHEERAVKVWDSATGAEVRTLRGHTAGVRCVAVSADGRCVASIAASSAAAEDGRSDRLAELILWDADSGQPQRRVHTAPARCLALSADVTLLATSGEDDRLRVWETATGRETFVSDDQPGPIYSIAFSRDGLLLAATGPAAVNVWDLTTGTRRHSLSTSSQSLTCVAFSPNGRRLAAVGYDEGIVHLWDTASGHDVFTLRGFGNSRPNAYGFMARVVFSPDGRRIAANNWDGSVNVWDAGSAGADSQPR